MTINTGVVSAQGGPDASRLIDDLLRGYSAVDMVRLPVLNITDTVEVDFGIGLISIVYIDEIKQQLTLHVWLRFVSSSSA